MTENEAIKELESRISPYDTCKADFDANEAIKIAVKAIKEVKQYRAIGTVEGYERAIQSSIENYNLYREYKAKVQEFEEIGTIEEFKTLKEKSVAKKPKSNKVIISGDSYAYCPHCKGSIEAEFMKPRNCRKCGGELDWS